MLERFLHDLAPGQALGLSQLFRPQGGVLPQNQPENDAHGANRIGGGGTQVGRERTAETEGGTDLLVGHKYATIRKNLRGGRTNNLWQRRGDCLGNNGREVWNHPIESWVNKFDSIPNARPQ